VVRQRKNERLGDRVMRPRNQGSGVARLQKDELLGGFVRALRNKRSGVLHR